MSSQASLGITHGRDQSVENHIPATDFGNHSIPSSSHRKPRNRQSSSTVERLLTVAEVANRLGMSQQWVRDHIDRRSPKIDVVRWGAAVRFRAADVDRFILEHVNAPRQRKRSR
jgi:excisionase family DNA binding protein